MAGCERVRVRITSTGWTAKRFMPDFCMFPFRVLGLKFRHLFRFSCWERDQSTRLPDRFIINFWRHPDWRSPVKAPGAQRSPRFQRTAAIQSPSLSGSYQAEAAYRPTLLYSSRQ